jgi:hypothetical protein
MRGKSEDYYRNKYKKLTMLLIWRNKNIFLDRRRDQKIFRTARFDTGYRLHFRNLYFRDNGGPPIST